MSDRAALDRILDLLNQKDVETLKKEDYDQFQYQGFDPYRLIEALVEMKNKNKVSDEAFADDICKMVAIGLIKGNVNDHNMTKMTDGGQGDLKDTMQKYGIVKGGGKGQGPKTITFPRVMAAFPDIAVRMTKVIGGKDFRGGPMGSTALPEVMKVQVFPAVIPPSLDDKVRKFLLTAALAYSIDQTIQISRLEKPDLKSLSDVQGQFILVSYNSPLPRTETRVQTFNQLGLPDKYNQILSVVTKYKELVDNTTDVVTEKEYKSAIAIV